MKEIGNWIWWTDQHVHCKQSVFFRCDFHYGGDGPLVVKLSASNRYKLYINGHYLCSGPQKGDRYRQYYDTIDLSAWLHPGKNLLAVHVVSYPNDYLSSLTFGSGPISVVSASRGGLWTSCEEPSLCTGSHWKWKLDDSYGFVEAEESKYAGDMEKIDGSKYPWGWMCPEYPDEDWSDAILLCPADTHRLGGVLYEWQLHPRTLPMLFEKTIQPVALSSQRGANFDPLLQKQSVTIPSHTDAYVDLDMGELVNAYVSLPMWASASGAKVTMEYGECYRIPDGHGGYQKGLRTDADHGDIVGEKDTYLTGVGEQIWEPYHFRVFRYLRLRIQTGDQNVSVHLPQIRLTGYPLEMTGRFEAENASVYRMWEISVRTLQRCMLDTYVDCPYYEQMQYVMDTVIEALLTFQISDDDRLVRRAIEDFHSTQRPDGMIQCNAPADFVQIIPPFSLYFVDLLYYHYQYYGDLALIRKYLPTVMGILRYFQERLDQQTGLLGYTGYWSFVDWVELWRANHGSPTADPEEPIYLYNHIFAYALERTAYLCGEIGWKEMAQEYLELREQLIRNINRDTMDENGYYRVCPTETIPSQHSQLWAVLSGCVEGEKAKELMRRCLKDPQLLQCSYSMSFYLFRAMEKAGIYDEIVDKWQPWEKMMALGLTTWMEDAVSQRSDCHGWSAVPLYDLTAVVLGVRPAKPGYGAILVEPHCLELGSMKATIATCRGPIQMCRTVTEETGGYHVHLSMSLPEEIPVQIHTGGSKYVSFCQREIMFDYKL